MSHQKILLVFLLLTLVLLRYDFFYFALPTSVKSGDALWTILENKVFHNNPLTQTSVKHLRLNYPQVNWDYVQKNVSGQDGYIISVWANKLSITGADKFPVIKEAIILPSDALSNHFLQIVSYDLVIISIMFYFYTCLSQNNFKINKSLTEVLIIKPLIISLALLVILIILITILSNIIFLLV